MFNSILLFAAVIALRHVLYHLTGQSFIPVLVGNVCCEFEPMQPWRPEQKPLESKATRVFSVSNGFCFFFQVSRKMADDIDIEAMLEAPYKKVRKMCQ